MAVKETVLQNGSVPGVVVNTQIEWAENLCSERWGASLEKRVLESRDL